MCQTCVAMVHMSLLTELGIGETHIYKHDTPTEFYKKLIGLTIIMLALKSLAFA
jgi:hypothetical protein